MHNEKWRDGLNEFLSPERTPGGCRVRSSLVIYNNTSCSNELLLYCMSNYDFTVRCAFSAWSHPGFKVCNIIIAKVCHSYVALRYLMRYNSVLPYHAPVSF
jgi:hypothetical protein